VKPLLKWITVDCPGCCRFSLKASEFSYKARNRYPQHCEATSGVIDVAVSLSLAYKFSEDSAATKPEAKACPHKRT
jgi:hypothetical protein